MLGLDHPLTGARYELEADGTITVHSNDRTGSFDGEGRWLTGDLRYADPAMCVWLSTGTARSRHAGTTTRSPEAAT